MITYTPPSPPPSPAAVVQVADVSDGLNFENARTLMLTAAADANEIAARGTGDPFVDTWRLLPKPTDEEIAPILEQVSGLNADLIRRVDWEHCRLLIESAVTSGNTMLDFITSPALRGPIIFYVPAPALNMAYAHYSGLFMTKPFGRDLGGKQFRMLGVLIGNGQVDVVYDHHDVSYHDESMRRVFTVGRHVSVKILNSRELIFSGLSTRVSLKLFSIEPIIQRMIKSSGRSVRVETNRGGQTLTVSLISRRPVPLELP